MLPLVVVGAHLTGMPLNADLTDRGAVLRAVTRTAPDYRMVALPSTPPKPGMVRVAEGGAQLEVEVWDMPLTQVGSFLATIPSPLGLGLVRLADGSAAHGFLCEAVAAAAAPDITTFGGWRAYRRAAAHVPWTG